MAELATEARRGGNERLAPWQNKCWDKMYGSTPSLRSVEDDALWGARLQLGGALPLHIHRKSAGRPHLRAKIYIFPLSMFPFVGSCARPGLYRKGASYVRKAC